MSDSPHNRRTLLVADSRYDAGSGHIRRSARLAQSLSGDLFWYHSSRDSAASGRSPAGVRTRAEIASLMGEEAFARVTFVDSLPGSYDRVIFDLRELSVAMVEAVDRGADTFGIDVAGSGRSWCDVLIDTLGQPPGAAPPNISDHGLLPLPETVRPEWPVGCTNVLIVFGGDINGSPYEERAIEYARAFAARTDYRVHVAGVNRKRLDDMALSSEIYLHEAPHRLGETVHAFDLVVTHYGITAFEAIWARVPVILANPSTYHDALSRQAGFTVAATATEAVAAVSGDWEGVVSRSRAVRPDERRDLAALIEAFIPARRTLTVHATAQGEQAAEAALDAHPSRSAAVTRFATRTFFRDPQSGLTYMVRFVAPTFTYDHSYFFEAYRAQYGRTYLEDFDHIVALGRERIRRIARHRSSQITAPRLLDIGCAYGPFLYAAREAGWDVTGMDVSPEAITYVTETLNIPAVSGSILDAATVGSLGSSYDIVTMWYVIEHVPQLAELLTTVRGLLRPGGTFAFATPYARGVSARRNLRAFLESSPEDHYTIFDRSSARATLAEFGFRVQAYHSTGHHPERFRPTPVPRALVAWWSRLAGRGDTFEVIAEAVK